MDDNVESRLSLKALEYKLSGIKKLSSKQLKKNKTKPIELKLVVVIREPG